MLYNGYKERRHPKRRNPIGRPHELRRVVNRRQSNRNEQINCAKDVEGPNQRPSASRVARNEKDTDKSQRGRKQVAQRRRVGKLWRQTWISRTASQKHQTEMTQRVKQQNRNQNRLRTRSAEMREEINPCGDVENHSRRNDIQRKNAIQHGFHIFK